MTSVNVSYRPLPGLRAFRLMMMPAGPRLVGTVTRFVYDGPVAHQEHPPVTQLPGGDERDKPSAYRGWSQPGFFVYPEDGFNPGYAGGYFAAVGHVSMFGMVVRHAGGARAQTLRINRLWVAAGRWGRADAHGLYNPPHTAALGIPQDASAVYFEWPSALSKLVVPAASGGPLDEALLDDLGRTYGCEAELVVGLSVPAMLAAAGVALAPKAEWKKPIHRVMLLDVPRAVGAA